MERQVKAKGVRIPVLGTSRKVLIRPSDERYSQVADGLANGEDVYLVEVDGALHLFVYSQTELDALAEIPLRPRRT